MRLLEGEELFVADEARAGVGAGAAGTAGVLLRARGDLLFSFSGFGFFGGGPVGFLWVPKGGLRSSSRGDWELLLRLFLRRSSEVLSEELGALLERSLGEGDSQLSASTVGPVWSFRL